MASTFVKDIMKEKIISIDESESIQDAAKKMTTADVGCVIVTKNDNPVGIITERDFVTKIAAAGLPLFSSVSGVMSLPLISIKPDDTVWDAAELMKAKGIHKLVVQDGNEVLGIVTTTDLVEICSLGSDSNMRKICDDILLRMKKEDLKN
jgi:signal-transduction protein with cAMP-binding, CBS, and nucleotidyltransferase domain